MMMQYGLPPSAFAVAFPFHLILNADLVIMQVGSALQRLNPQLPGKALADCFELCRPVISLTFAGIRDNQQAIFLLASRWNAMRLKGQMLYLADTQMMAFLCSPWITDLAEIAPLGLALGDFAIHDPVSDYLLLLQSKNTALQDSKKLAQRLSAKQESLKLTNQELQREISERIRIEGELEQARDRALETSRLKSEFLATMSHEIRTPMNGIIGMTELLIESHLTQEQREYAEVVLHEAEHLLGIINDILDFSKIEAGKVILDEQTFSLLKLVDSVIELLTPQAEAKRLALIPFVAPEAPILVRGDPGRLRQILLNLVANAIKFTTHGEVYVRLEPIGQDAGLVTLRVTIIDTGIGISPEAQRLLFQPFTQVDGGTTRKHGGTGLGLAIAQRLVRLMQGEIGVQSCPGAGSTFWFTVVLGNATEPAQAPHPPLAPLLGMRALVVDGNATWRTVLQHYLTHWGLQVTSASRGAEALLMLMEAATLGQPYTLALIDQALPGMDGRALGQAIQYEPTLASTQRILLTAFHDKGGDAAALGYAACLAKPLHYERLLTTVSQVIVRAGQEA